MGTRQAVEAVMANASRNAEQLRAIVEQVQIEGHTTLRAIARALNRRGVATPRGVDWRPTTVKRLLNRVKPAANITPGDQLRRHRRLY